jgi:hypothetical protein
MNKKILIFLSVVLLVLLAGLPLSGAALAHDNRPGWAIEDTFRKVGQVTSSGQNSFTIQDRLGAQYTLEVDELTRFRSKDQADLSFSDLKSGAWVIAVGEYHGPSELIAKAVIILPGDVDPNLRIDQRLRGRVSAVDPAGKSLTLTGGDGQETRLAVNDATRYPGEAKSLAEIKTGMLAGVLAVKQADGSLLAAVVKAGSPLEQVIGKVVSVDAAGGKITLQPLRKDAAQATFGVDASTRFISRGRQVKALSDLREGMLVAVRFQGQAGQTPLAKVILAGIKPKK